MGIGISRIYLMGEYKKEIELWLYYFHGLKSVKVNCPQGLHNKLNIGANTLNSLYQHVVPQEIR